MNNFNRRDITHAAKWTFKLGSGLFWMITFELPHCTLFSASFNTHTMHTSITSPTGPHMYYSTSAKLSRSLLFASTTDYLRKKGEQLTAVVSSLLIYIYIHIEPSWCQNGRSIYI